MLGMYMYDDMLITAVLSYISSSDMRQFFVRKENAFGECAICPCQLILLFAHSGKFFNRSYSLDIYLRPVD